MNKQDQRAAFEAWSDDKKSRKEGYDAFDIWQAAIEHDRKGRGEPVAEVQLGPTEHQSPEKFNMTPAEPVKVPPDTTYCQHPHCQTTGGCQGPCSKKQSEPVKVVSDEDLIALARQYGSCIARAPRMLQFDFEQPELVRFARVLLSRYGQSTENPS